jgi:hypothetical protein
MRRSLRPYKLSLQQMPKASSSMSDFVYDPCGNRYTLTVLRAGREKADRDWQTLQDATRSLVGDFKSAEEQTRLRLTGLATGMDLDKRWELCGHGSERESAILSRHWFRLILTHEVSSRLCRGTHRGLTYTAVEKDKTSYSAGCFICIPPFAKGG